MKVDLSSNGVEAGVQPLGILEGPPGQTLLLPAYVHGTMGIRRKNTSLWAHDCGGLCPSSTLFALHLLRQLSPDAGRLGRREPLIYTRHSHRLRLEIGGCVDWHAWFKMSLQGWRARKLRTPCSQRQLQEREFGPRLSSCTTTASNKVP